MECPFCHQEIKELRLIKRWRGDKIYRFWVCLDCWREFISSLSLEDIEQVEVNDVQIKVTTKRA